MKPRVIVVDDEERMASVIATALGRAGYECATCSSGAAALKEVDQRGADAVVTDLKMPEMGGMELLRELRARRASLPVILITAHGSVPSAVAAMREGAFDYVTKPFDNDELRAVVARALELTRLERENRYLRQEVAGRYAPDEVVAESPRSRELLDLVRRVAPSRSTVLIQGESGTGKELVARLLHYWSDRVGRAFVAVNCKAFAEGVLESELFGHEKGIVHRRRRGAGGLLRAGRRRHAVSRRDRRDHGADFQAKLLRVLQEGEVLRVGGAEPRRVDVRVVAATNRPLRAEVDGRPLSRGPVLPAQRDPDPARSAARAGRGHPAARPALPGAPRARGRPAPGAERRGRAGAARHSWPGNVRELENAIERAVVLARGDTIGPDDLLLEERPRAEQPTGEGTLQEALDSAAAVRIRAALEAAGGQRAEAARALGIDRTTLYRMMKRFDIE